MSHTTAIKKIARISIWQFFGLMTSAIPNNRNTNVVTRQKIFFFIKPPFQVEKNALLGIANNELPIKYTMRYIKSQGDFPIFSWNKEAKKAYNKMSK